MTLDHHVGALTIERLAPADLAEAFAFLDGDSVLNVYLLALVLRDALSRPFDEFWGVRRDGHVVAMLHLGAQTGAVLPVGEEPRALALMAERVVARRRVLPHRFQVIGPRTAVRAVVARLAQEALTPRLDRNQVYMALARGELPPFARLPALRCAGPDDFDRVHESGALLRAEELDEDPRLADPAGYSKRVDEECRGGHTYLWLDRHGLCFRASISAFTPDAAQVSGVFTPPVRRGKGKATRALSELCTRLFERTRHVCLFVNEFNSPALAVYRRLGFRDVKAWASAFYDVR